MAAMKLNTSTLCNLIIKERTTKYVQVNIKADVKSRGILCKPELSNKFTPSYAITKDSVFTTDKYVQCDIAQRKASSVCRSSQSSPDSFDVAIEKVLFILKSSPRYDSLQYDVSYNVL